jgi:hypothetical protein
MTKTRIILIIAIVACVLSTMAINRVVNYGKGNSDEGYKSDSSFIVYTVKEYSRRGWYWYNSTNMYQIRNDEIAFFVERIFYSPDKKKLVAWVGEKTYNAPTIEKYNKNNPANKICPLAGDTVFHFTVLIGYKDDNGLWKLYPWGNRQVPCCNTVEIGVTEMEQYYFKDIKKDYFEAVGQAGKSKGIVRNQPYKYAINDKEFWSSLLWQRDTVGANNRYPFEVTYYRLLTDTCFKCAEEMKLPLIDYPDSLMAH